MAALWGGCLDQTFVLTRFIYSFIFIQGLSICILPCGSQTPSPVSSDFDHVDNEGYEFIYHDISVSEPSQLKFFWGKKSEPKFLIESAALQ